MAKRTSKKSSRTDPRQNRTLAITNVLEKMPEAAAADVVAAVEAGYGHRGMDVRSVYMVKTKLNKKASSRKKKAAAARRNGAANPKPIQLVAAIRTARELLKATGSVADATAVLQAVHG